MPIQPLISGLKQVFKKQMTYKYPYEKAEVPENFRGRHFLYMDRCTGCGICAWICPEECIRIVDAEDGKKYPQFYYGRCCFCHFCVDYCPKIALEATGEYELASYEQKPLVWTPERLAKPPEKPEKEVKLEFHPWKGVSHK